MRPDGLAEELAYYPDGSGPFPLEFARYGNIGDPRPRNGKINDDRAAVLKRITEPLTPTLTPTRAADLLRLRKSDEALNLLARAPNRTDFRILANLIHAHALRGEWGEALRRHEVLLDLDLPDDLAPDPAQRQWLARVERDYYRRWLKLHYEEQQARQPPAREGVFPLFGQTPPADAIAIVQQLLLWAPDDNRLYWLLAELYWQNGRLRQAERLFDSLASEGRQMSNRPLLMEHRAAVKRAVAALPPEKTDEPILDEPEKPDNRSLLERLGLDTTRLITAISLFVVCAVILLMLQIRKLMRRRR